MSITTRTVRITLTLVVATVPIVAAFVYCANTMRRRWGVSWRTLSHTELRAWGAAFIVALLLSALTATYLEARKQTKRPAFISMYFPIVLAFLASPLAVEQLIEIFKTYDVSIWADHSELVDLAPIACTQLASLLVYRLAALPLFALVLATVSGTIYTLIHIL